MNPKALWYEISPYVYFLAGLAAALFSRSAIGFVFSAALIGISVVIFAMRRIYRSPAREMLRKYARPLP